MFQPVLEFNLTAGQTGKPFAAPVWMTLTITGTGKVSVQGAVGSSTSDYIPSNSDFATLREYVNEGVYSVSGLPTLLRFSCTSGNMRVRALLKDTPIPNNIESDEIVRGLGQINAIQALSLKSINDLNTAVQYALAAVATNSKFISLTTQYPAAPTPIDLIQYPGDIRGLKYNETGGIQSLLWNRSTQMWDTIGKPTATIDDVASAKVSAISVTQQATKAALSLWDRQGVTYAFANGSRWRWAAAGTLYPGVVIPALDGGIWIREFAGPLRAAWCDVKGDGVTDDTVAMQNAINAAIDLRLPLQLPIGTIITTAELIANGYLILNGEYSAIGMFEWASPLKIPRTEIRRITRGGNEQAVLRARGAGSYFSYVQFTASQISEGTGADYFGPIKYFTANLGMVDLSQSTDYGVVFEGTARGATMYRCEVTQAAKRGIVQGQVYGVTPSADGRISPRAIATDQGNVMRLDNVMVASCGAGVTMNATDSKLVFSYLHHNAGEGMVATAAFPHVMGNRSEWNAKQGYIMRAAEFDFIANLADRNGWSGLFIDSNWRGQVVGNSFSRNGGSGDGITGRWGFATPGTPGYLLTPEEECCHVRLKYMRNVAFSGNTYRAGLSDSNDGVLSPARIYYGDNVADCSAIGNTGEIPYFGGSGGYAPTHNLYATGVEQLINFSQKSMRVVLGLNDTMSTVYGTDFGPTDTFDIALPNEFLGTIELYGGKFQGTVCGVIEIVKPANNAYSLANIRSTSGTVPIASATLVPANAPTAVRIAFASGAAVYVRYVAKRVM